MKNPEFTSTPRHFPVIELDEIEFSLLLPAQVHRLLCDFAAEQGAEPANILYTGIDLADDEPLVNGFGDRVETWAFSDDEVAHASKGRSSGDYDTNSPFYYALRGTSAPGVILADGSKFIRFGVADPDHPDRIETEYQLKDGLTFDDAVVGVLRITTD